MTLGFAEISDDEKSKENLIPTREQRERERERKREMMKQKRKYHTCCLKFYVAFARLALSLYFLF